MDCSLAGYSVHEILQGRILEWVAISFSWGGFSPYEMLYGRLFTYINHIFLDPETQTLWSYTMAIGQFQQEIFLWGANQDPKDSEGLPLYAPGTQVLFKIWKDGSPNSPLQPTLKGSYPVILSTPTAVKVPGNDSWIH